MKRSRLLLITAVAAVGLLAFVVSVFPTHSGPALAAPGSSQDPFEKMRGAVYAPLYQGDQINCTVQYTTTDKLGNVNACAVGESVEFCAQNKATDLADYSNLALIANTDVPDGEEREVAVHEDWFRLDNAGIGAVYSVEAIPNRTVNYNLGMIVYDLNYEEVTQDIDQVDNNKSSVTFEPDNAGPYFVRVFQITQDCAGRTYNLEVSKDQPTPTPTLTPLPGAAADGYEPNDSFDEAMAEGPTLPIQVPILLQLTFHTVDDGDFFRFYTKDGGWYQATTSDLNLVDTVIEIYDKDRTRIARNDDGPDGLASEAAWKAAYDGYYFIVVRNNVQSRGGYDLTLTEVTAPATVTPGPSPTPGATPRGKADDCESNGDFQRACVLPVNVSQTFNFVPVYGEGPDNDFFKVWVKPGLHFRFETSDLSAGVDPNMIVFTGPSWDQAIGGNDDIEPCNYNSAFNYYATYSGWLYLLVGTGDRTPSDVMDSSYTLICKKSTTPFSDLTAPQASTPDPSGKLPTAMPTPTPTRPGSPIATPRPGAQALSIRALATPTPPATAAPRFVPIDLAVYYDANGDGQPGAGEGITGVSAQAYDVATNELLAQGFTDNQGRLSFTVSSQGPVRLKIPFLGFSHLIPASSETQGEATVQVRVPPR